MGVIVNKNITQSPMLHMYTVTFVFLTQQTLSKVLISSQMVEARL
jgi:hypothetical protein